MEKLSPTVIKALGYYVYLYIHPLDGQIFYIGKGKGNRVLDHLKDTGDSRKAKIIQELVTQGLEPQIEILIHGLENEALAYQVEAAAIDLLGKQQLANQVRGWRSGYHGRMTLQEAVSLYEHASVEIAEPAILIRINQLYRYGMSPIELYDATRGVWKVGERRNKAAYAFAVYEGIVREIYKIMEWFPAGSTFSTRPADGLAEPDRWEFVGQLADESLRQKYLLKSVEHYFTLHSQNPITYANC